MNTNVITAVFGALRETKVRPRYRYDRGQVLVLKGIRDLPDYYEVHFANIGGEVDATPEIGTAEGVIIPDSFFESAAGILAYIYVHDEATDGTTIYKVTIPIIDRPRPADTEPTQEEADIISQAIVALNENVGRAEESAETAQSAADGAAQAERNAGVSAERAEAAEQAAETSATGASSSAAAAQAAALSAAESESQASAHKDAAMLAADNADAASASASDHASAAQSAAGQAEQYKNTAVAAGNAAQTAATNAGAARTAAEAAQTAAESAQTAAEDAMGAAETARTDAQTYAGQAAQSATDAAQSAAGAAQTLGQVRTEGAAQIAAVDAEGQRVLDSIPEDYSQIEDDITDLKSQTRGHLLSSDIKNALLACFAKVAWSDGDGQDYYDALESALYPSAQIVSINAVYNQSGTVYVTDQLNSLKTDLVVTATYDDGSIETISNYALSGTLVAGTSTITVTYQSLTDTFAVTVSQHIPSAYAEYGYAKYIGTAVSNTTAAVPYIIHTNEYPNLNDLTFDFELSPVAAQTGSTAAIMGGNAANSGNTDTVEFYGRTDTQRISAFTHGTALGIDSIPNMQVGSIVHVRLEPGNASPATLNADALSVDGAWTNTNTVQKAIGLFGRLHGARGTVVPFVAIGALKLYSVADDTLVGAYYPCVRTADNVIGYYDTVSDTFCTASNADCVTIGNDNCRYAVGMWGE